MQKQHPILYATPMVQALIQDLKTKTRRTTGLDSFNLNPKEWEFKRMEILPDGKLHACFIPTDPDSVQGIFTAPFPYGLVGDLLWVRETTKVGAWNHEENEMAFDYKTYPYGAAMPWVQFDDDERFIELTDKLIKKLDKLGIEPNVDEENECFTYTWPTGQSPFNWTPAIHMPKEACRIWLEITDIKVERLKDISEQDAIAEGIERMGNKFKNYLKTPKIISKLETQDTAYYSFLSLWESINGVGSSELNPWVWVITFKKVVKPCNK